MIDRNCDQANWLAQQLRAAGVEVLNDVVLNQLVVAFGSDENTQQAIAALQDARVIWAGGTRWHGREALRISISAWATTQDDMAATLKAITTAAVATRA